MRRLTEAGAYLIVIGAIAVLPMWWAIPSGSFPPRVRWAGALGVWVPAAVYVLLLVFGRPRDRTVLGSSFTIGLLYWIAAVYASYSKNEVWLKHLAGEGVLLLLLSVVITALWTGLPARKV